MKVVGDKIVVAVLNDGVDQSGESSFVTESAFLDAFEDFGQIGVNLILAVEMVVAEIFDVFRKVAKEEYILVASLTSDLDLLKMSQCLLRR